MERIGTLNINILCAFAVAVLLAGGCAGPSSSGSSKGWQCTAQDEPGSAFSGPHLYHHNAPTKQAAADGAMAQCRYRSTAAATCFIDAGGCQPL